MFWAWSVASCADHHLEMPCLPWGTRSGVKPPGSSSVPPVPWLCSGAEVGNRGMRSSRRILCLFGVGKRVLSPALVPLITSSFLTCVPWTIPEQYPAPSPQTPSLMPFLIQSSSFFTSIQFHLYLRRNDLHTQRAQGLSTGACRHFFCVRLCLGLAQPVHFQPPLWSTHTQMEDGQTASLLLSLIFFICKNSTELLPPQRPLRSPRQ